MPNEVLDAQEAANARKIDLDRGVIFSEHKQYGFYVYMYVDDPGVYLSVHGTPLSEQLAKEAGLDVEKYGKAHKLKMRLADARQKIEADLAMQTPIEECVKEAGGFKVIHIGLERYWLRDPDGNQLTEQPLSKEQALRLLDQLVPVTEKE